MKINYDEIITKANARKETLKLLQEHLDQFELQAAALETSVQYFDRVMEINRMLDTEARGLLGPLDRPLSHLVYVAQGKAWFEEGSSAHITNFRNALALKT